jgi:hypothetical protein
VVATEASCDDVVPFLLSAAGDRNHMVEREIFGRKFPSAILARVVIACIDVGPGELHSIVILNADVFEQSDDGRELYCESDCVDFFVIFVNDLNLACKKQRQRLFPRNDSQWFI